MTRQVKLVYNTLTAYLVSVEVGEECIAAFDRSDEAHSNLKVIRLSNVDVVLQLNESSTRVYSRRMFQFCLLRSYDENLNSALLEKDM